MQITLSLLDAFDLFQCNINLPDAIQHESCLWISKYDVNIHGFHNVFCRHQML